jgi:hemerythrin-like domain-containing protein
VFLEGSSHVCEYCGCQDLATIAELTAEHDILVNLSGQVCRALQAGDLDTAALRTRTMATVLAPHTRVEEEALFPAMAEEFGEHVQGLLSEHRLIEGVLTESAQRTPDDLSWPERLQDALEVLREHILKEQDGLFPAALSVLDPAQWDLVELVRSRVGSGVHSTVAGR